MIVLPTTRFAFACAFARAKFFAAKRTHVLVEEVELSAYVGAFVTFGHDVGPEKTRTLVNNAAEPGAGE